MLPLIQVDRAGYIVQWAEAQTFIIVCCRSKGHVDAYKHHVIRSEFPNMETTGKKQSMSLYQNADVSFQ